MQVLIEIDAATVRRLEKVAPAKSRKRSAFIRAAIQKSLWELEEQRTRRAYVALPDEEPAVLDPSVWEAMPYGGFDPPDEEVGRSTARRTRASRSARPRRSRK